MGCGGSSFTSLEALAPCEELPTIHPRSGDLEDALRRLNAAYGGDAADVRDSADAAGRIAVDLSNQEIGSALYGEVLPVAFAEAFARLGAKPAMRFYDLGCGSGKLVNLAAMIGLTATGIELECSRYDMACAAEARLHQDVPCEPLRFVHASILDFDFSDADIVLINSVAFGIGMLRSLASTAGRMRPGSKIVSFRSLPGQEFKELETVPMAVSWHRDGEVALWHVQEVLAKHVNSDAMIVS